MPVLFSYTDMARRHRPPMTIIPIGGRPDKIGPGLVLSGLGDIEANPSTMAPAQFDAWFASLPPVVQQRVEDGLQKIARALPPLAQVALARGVIGSGHDLPFGLPLEGLGASGCDCPTRNLGDLGFSAAVGATIGAVAGGLLSAGVSIYTSKLSNDLQKDLAKQAGKNDAAVMKAQAEAALATQKLLADAQVQAAQVLAASQVERSRINAPMVASAVRWGGLAVAAVALVGAGYLFFKKKRK